MNVYRTFQIFILCIQNLEESLTMAVYLKLNTKKAIAILVFLAVD